MIKKLIQLDQLFIKLISYLLTSVFSLLIILCFYSIMARWLQLTNLWVDPLNRHLVLVLIFLGATLAVDKKKHIKIDALGLFLETKLSQNKILLYELFLNFFTMIIVYFLMQSGIQFWKSECEFPVDAFLGLKQYHLAIIIPLGFFLILIKYLLNFLITITQFQSTKILP